MKFLVCLTLLSVLCGSVYADQTFKDVPSDHWAASSVQTLADKGIMQGYPDGTYKGDKYVTRYELAAALQRVIELIQNSQKPLVTEKKELSLSPKSEWAKKPVDFLKAGGFIQPNSELLKGGDKQVTHDQLAQALASVAAKLIELTVPPAERE